MEKTYNPEAIERKWYEIWENNGYFDADQWEFYGIGGIEHEEKKISIYNNTRMRLLPKLSLTF